MQFIRSTTWRLLGLLFLGLFICALISPQTLGGEVTSVPQSAVWWTAAAFTLGLIVRPRFVQTSETLTHEVGHAFASALLGGRIKRIAINRDTSGVTYSSGERGRIKDALVSAAGPLATPGFFLFTALMVTSNLPHVWLLFVLVGVVLVTVTTVRNVWGWVVGVVAIAILWQVVRSSLAVGSDPTSWQLPAVWSTSSMNAAAVLTAFNAGIALRYSWQFRRPRNSGSDEYRFGRALRIGPFLGGHVILLANVAMVSAGFLLFTKSQISH